MKEDLKRIIYIGNFSFPYGNAAGKRVYANGKILRSIGYEVVFFGMDKGIDKKTPLHRTRNEFDGFIYYNFAYPGKVYNWINYQKCFDLFEEVITKEKYYEDLKAIIFYGSPRISLFINKLLVIGRKQKVTIISDCVDWLSVKTKNVIFNIIKNTDNYYQKAILNKNANGIITVSSFLSTYYRNKGCKTVIIPPLSPDDTSTTEKYDLKNIPVICYSGFPFRKGEYINNPKKLKDRIDLIIELLHHIKMRGVDFEFHIFGFEKDEYLKSLPFLEKYINELGSSIIFHGFVPNENVSKFIKDAHFTILLRDINRDTTAGFPTKVSESISLGTPVIVNKTSDLDQYIREGQSGYFLDLDDYKKTENKLYDILIDMENIEKMKKQCKGLNIFDYQTYVYKVGEFLKTIG